MFCLIQVKVPSGFGSTEHVRGGFEDDAPEVLDEEEGLEAHGERVTVVTEFDILESSK